MFKLLLLSMVALVGLSLVGSWEIDRFVQRSAAAANRSATHANHSPQITENVSTAQRVRNWIAIVQGISLLVCAGLVGFGLRLRTKARREESRRAALARSVEDRTLELRREVEERRQMEDLHRGQRRILEMLIEPNDLTPEEILQSLAETIAAGNQDRECAVHLMDRRGKLLQLAASTGVTDP